MPTLGERVDDFLVQKRTATIVGHTDDQTSIQLGASQILGSWDKPGGIRGDTSCGRRRPPVLSQILGRTHPVTKR